MALFDPGLFASGLFADGLFYEGVEVMPTLTARYHLNETSGTTAADSVGSNDATLENTTFSASSTVGLYPGSSFALSLATDDYLHANAGITAYPFSLTAWITKTASADGGIFSIVDRSDATKYLGMYINSSGIMQIYRRNTTEIITGATHDTGVSGVTHFVAAVFHSDTSVSAYMDDAAAVDLTGLTSVAIDGTFDAIAIGSRRITTPGLYHEGVIDDVRLYDSALSDSDIIAVYNDTSDGPIDLELGYACSLKVGRGLDSDPRI